MKSYTELVDHLALQIREYPRGGGARPVGMLILQRGNQDIPLDKDVPNRWPDDPAEVGYNLSPLGTALLKAGLEYSGGTDGEAYSPELLEQSIPHVVAEILLGIQFHDKKAVASAFRIAEIVCRVLGLNLNYDEDFTLGTYLLSCLIKAEYYRHYEMTMDNGRRETALAVRKKAIKEIPERDAWTQFEPFPPWTSGFDAEHRRLVKPMHPQLKETYWVPDDWEFVYRTKKGGDLSIHHELPKAMVNIYQQDKDAGEWTVPPSMWVRGVNRLEQNAYRINQKLLGVLSGEKNSFMWFPERNTKLEREEARLLKERSKPQDGEEWKSLPKSKRTLEKLTPIGKKQTEQIVQRREDGEKPYDLEDGDPARHCSRALHRIHQEYWISWRETQRAKIAHAAKYSKFVKELRKAQELGDRTFYQRAFLDSRGRVYLSRSRVNYQAGDLCRGLMEFAEGKQVRKKDMKYLWIHLGNITGVKGDAKNKEAEAKKRKARFLRWGRNPAKTYDQWKGVSDPWQCIRACIELVELEKNPKHKSHLIVEIDQSTSCLQHIALIRGDEKLARRVNLGPDYNDIYLEIAGTMPELDGLAESDKRKIIKMVLVPWTYGGNAWSAKEDFHTSQIPYLSAMTSRQRLQCAVNVQQAIERELAAAVGYTNEMVGHANMGIGRGSRNLHWGTPSDFSVHCYKQVTTEIRARLWVGHKPNGRDHEKRLTGWKPEEEVRIRKLKKGIAPNFVHSVDAAVVHMVLADTPEDQPVVSVHDALGTHIRNVGEAKDRFAKAFHRIYSSMHPLLIARDGVPPAVATPSDEDVPPQLLKDIYEPQHMTV